MNQEETLGEIDQYIFKHPFTCMIAGPSKSGKTTLLKKFLTNNNIIIDKSIETITYCYTRWQDSFHELDEVEPKIKFNQGLPSIDELSSSNNNLIILDDLMREAGVENAIYDIFTVDSHHKNISVFFLTQNLFPKEKNARTISLNCNYIILLNNPRDRNQILHLARQMFPNDTNFLIESFNDAVESRLYGYLFLDLTQTTKNTYRVQTGVCPDEDRIVYLSKKI